MVGVLLNTATVIVGSLMGLIFKKSIPEKITSAVMVAIGLCTLMIGVDGALEGNNAIVMILSLVAGTILGTLLNLDGLLNRAGESLEGRFKRTDGKVSVAEGFVTASLLFCVGAMTIVGSLNAGISGDNELLFTKSILDLISSCVLASTLGIGVLFAAAFVFLFQGGLVLSSGLLEPLLNEVMIAEITCVGSVMIIGLGLNLLGLTKIKVANMLPGILVAPFVYLLIGLLPL